MFALKKASSVSNTYCFEACQPCNDIISYIYLSAFALSVCSVHSDLVLILTLIPHSTRVISAVCVHSIRIKGL